MRRILGTAAVIAGLLLAAPAIASTEVTRSQDGTAQVQFYLADAESCITTDIFIIAYESRVREGPGGFETRPALAVNIHRFDTCASVPVMSAYGDVYGNSANPPIVQISNNSDRASAQGVVEMYDSVQGISFPVEVDLAWSATGPLSGYTDRVSSQYPDVRLIFRTSSKSRDAEATGALLLEGRNILAGTLEQSGGISFGQGTTIRVTRR